MRHADQLIGRILYLEGVPNLQRLGKVEVGETVVEQLRLDHALKIEAPARLNSANDLAVEAHDNGTGELFEKIFVSEEGHVDWLEARLELVKQVGEKNFLAQQIHAS